MACMSKKHEELNSDGFGACSVPMWQGGLPGGFCDERAFGKQTQEYLDSFPSWNYKYRMPVYAPSLACVSHGGPECDGIILPDGSTTGCNQSHGDCPRCEK